MIRIRQVVVRILQSKQHTNAHKYTPNGAPILHFPLSLPSSDPTTQIPGMKSHHRHNNAIPKLPLNTSRPSSIIFTTFSHSLSLLTSSGLKSTLSNITLRASEGLSFQDMEEPEPQ